MWRIYYDDGSVLSDQPIPVGKRVGVISVATYDPAHNWTFWISKDWYILQHDGEWLGVDQAGLHDQIITRLECLSHVLQGRTVSPHAKYQAVIDRMMQECQPPKTGWHSGER